jgi:hypothetical protein
MPQIISLLRSASFTAYHEAAFKLCGKSYLVTDSPDIFIRQIQTPGDWPELIICDLHSHGDFIRNTISAGELLILRKVPLISISSKKDMARETELNVIGTLDTEDQCSPKKLIHMVEAFRLLQSLTCQVLMTRATYKAALNVTAPIEPLPGQRRGRKKAVHTPATR